MFRVQTQVVLVPSAEARQVLGVQVRPAGLAAWRELARRGQGLEMAHFQIVHEGTCLAISSRLRRDGLIEIALGIGDARMAARVIPAADLRRAEMLAAGRAHRAPQAARAR